MSNDLDNVLMFKHSGGEDVVSMIEHLINTGITPPAAVLAFMVDYTKNHPNESSNNLGKIWLILYKLYLEEYSLQIQSDKS